MSMATIYPAPVHELLSPPTKRERVLKSAPALLRVSCLSAIYNKPRSWKLRLAIW